MVTTNARMQCRRGTVSAWSSANPVLAQGELGIVTGVSPMLCKVGDGTTAWNSLPAAMAIEDIAELAAGDPTELSLSTAGGVTTLTVLDTLARMPLHRATYYYANVWAGLSGSQTMTQDRMNLQRVWLSKGTMDRIGVEVNTAVASLICRLGVYADNGGLPDARVAEASSTADCSTTGVKDLTISATIPKNGFYWFASVTQAAAGGALRGPATAGLHQVAPMPIGTSAPSGSTGYLSHAQNSVTGALPANIGTLNATAQNFNHLVHYRYSSVG